MTIVLASYGMDKDEGAQDQLDDGMNDDVDDGPTDGPILHSEGCELRAQIM